MSVSAAHFLFAVALSQGQLQLQDESHNINYIFMEGKCELKRSIKMVPGSKSIIPPVVVLAARTPGLLGDGYGEW